MQIIYEPHPVTPERKAELIGQGLKIIDAIFAPEPVDLVEPVIKKRQPKKGVKNAD